jgi:hypothetical protein
MDEGAATEESSMSDQHVIRRKNVDLVGLKEAAENAAANPQRDSHDWYAFHNAASPDVILALLSRLAEVTAARDTACDALESWVEGAPYHAELGDMQRQQARENIEKLRKAGT